ncbi:DUF6261 family protein [Saccharicrinis aurantiacus]|uniref:DUF6261 family protein n=1 Tax=Saccharicrinis aurantiacus TaxID=1849719 RepID=UPI00248FB011|nr:DUF6261 family protein [Saccharicrinis aurantiacus]
MEKVIGHSRTTEVGSLLTLIINSYKSSQITNSFLDSLFVHLGERNMQLLTAVRRSKITSMLDDKDELRDEKIRSLYYVLLGASHHPDTAIAKAGIALLAIFNKYGLAMLRESYANESTLLNSLIQDFENPILASDIELVAGCSILIGDLKIMQNDFELVHTQFEEDKALQGNLLSATELKKELIYNINTKLVVYLEAMILAEPKSFGNLTRSIAQIIADNNAAVKKRRKTQVEELTV